MKHKILTIIALLAVMVVLTGAASAAEISLLRNGTVLADPNPVKNNDHFNIDLLVPALRPQDILPPANNGSLNVARLQCTNPAGIPNQNCSIDDFNLTKLIDNFTVTSIPTSIQNDSARIDVNAPLSRQPGTEYSFIIDAGPWGIPAAPASASRTLVLTGGFITGKKCNDLDGNGICGQGELGLEGWTIILRDENGTEVNRTTTDANGNYAFKGRAFPVVTGSVVSTIFLGFRGTFTVEEVPQASWNQTGPPGNSYSVIIDNVDRTGLDFANNQNTTIIVVKNTVGGDGTFNYTTTGGDGLPSSLSVFTSSGTGSKTFTNITPGTYSISEIVPSGWNLTSSSCSAGSGSPSSFIVPPGGTVTCTFNNKFQEGNPGKSIGWGDLGSSASFDYWVYYKFLPSGTMSFTDKINKVEIKATRIDSIDTTCNELTCETWPKSGTIKGMADVTENGALKGNFAFTVNVEDKADPSHGQDKFSISVPGYMPSFMSSGYSMGGAVTFGNLKAIKTS